MNKYLMVILITLGLASCEIANGRNYLANPTELQKAMQACPAQHPDGLSCEQLGKLAVIISSLSIELQSGPQAFGNKILALQQTIAQQEQELAKNDNTELKASLNKNRDDLAHRLIVVRWFESPVS